MTYASTKTYGHDIGLSCSFRQWRASSHCRFIHGYAISVRYEFIASALNETNWVVDFGGLKDVKAWLQATFDHKLLVAKDDPELDTICALAGLGIADIVVVDATGCEAFSKIIYDAAEEWLKRVGHWPRVELYSVEVREHGANSAIYFGKDGR